MASPSRSTWATSRAAARPAPTRSSSSASLNVTGSENNVGVDAENDAEARCRDAANGRWLSSAVDRALETGATELVVFVQADPWWSLHRGHEPFLGQLEAAARRLRKPVLLAHGDTHMWQVDYPLPG